MNRRLLLLAALAAWAQCSTAWAQIAVPESTPLGQPIVAKVDLPDGGKVAWKADAGSSVVNAGKGRAYLWAAPGSHVVQAVVAPAGDAEIIWLESSYSVGDAPSPPTPIVKTLAQLAGPDAQKLGSLYAALAPQVQDVANVASFKAVHAKLLADQGLTDNGAAAEIAKRLAVALVDPLDHAKLRSVLEGFVAELGSLPPPVIVEGKRLLVILRESEEIEGDVARMTTALRAGIEGKYLADKGHQLLILDDDSKDENGQPVPLVEQLKSLGVPAPAQFVIDPATKAVLGKQPLSATPTAVIEFVKEHGG